VQAYEAMFIFRPGLKEEEQKALIEGLEKILTENQAKKENSQALGKRYLAYEINKNKEGVYYLLNFSSPTGTVVSKLNHSCKLNENVLRTLIIKK
jgi:small subunit ribosomal protein S6